MKAFSITFYQAQIKPHGFVLMTWDDGASRARENTFEDTVNGRRELLAECGLKRAPWQTIREGHAYDWSEE